MFFWFSSGDSFSIVSALVKLVLVITCSTLIICFCHKLTNFKRSRRHKYDFVRASSAAGWRGQPFPADLTQQQHTTTTTTTTGTSGGNWRPLNGVCETGQPLTSWTTTTREQQQQQIDPALAAALAYDPYNSALRSLNLGPGGCSITGQSFQLPLVGSADHLPPGRAYAGLYGPHPSEALAAYHGLAAQNQQPDSGNSQSSGAADANDDDACPSYEEATRGTTLTHAVATADNQNDNDDPTRHDGAQADIPIFALNLMSQQSQQQQQQHLERAQQMLDQQAAGGNAPLGRLISSLAGGSDSSGGEDDDADELAADDAAARAAAVNESSSSSSSVATNKASDILQIGADDLRALNETQLASTTPRATTTSDGGDDDDDGGEPTQQPDRPKSHHKSGRPRAQFVYLPSGISVQFCDADNRSCLDENAVCKLGACVCKPGYFVRRQSPSGLCQSISDLMKNCESDLQCQAFNVDLVCDQTGSGNSSSSNNATDGAFCDCTPGLYYDLETNTCLPCQRPSASNPTIVSANHTQDISNSSQLARNVSAPLPTDGATGSGRPPPPPLCRPVDLAKLAATKRKHKHSGVFTFPAAPIGANEGSRSAPSDTHHNSAGLPPTWTAYLGAGHAHPNHAPNNHNPNPHHTPASSSSDPLRIRTPIDVFMGAIMLFTLFTVAWFFLQRIIHDCRTIIKSLRASAGVGGPADLMLAPDANFSSAYTSGRHIAPHIFGEHHPLEVNGQSLAAARLAAAALAAASAHHRHDSMDYNNNNNSPDGAGAGFFARRSTGGGGGACGSPIGYMATTLTGSSLARYHRLLAASFQAAAAATSTASPTLPGSNSQTGLATAVTNSGQNSAASTRSTITRLVGDGVQSPEPELNTYARGLNHFPIIHMPHYHGAFLPAATPNYLASSAFEAPPPKYEEAIAQQDCSFFGYIHASSSPPPPPVTAAREPTPPLNELAETSVNNQSEEPCESSVQPDEELNGGGTSDVSSNANANAPSESQQTAAPTETTTVDCESSSNGNALAHA